MSKCVVRMEMPKSCPCELAGGYDIPLPCFASHGVPKRCKEFDECVEKGTKPDWCPFICSLPEGHGRLVDADDCIKHLFTEWVKGEISNSEWCNIRQCMNEETTIVPAERSE